jgi:hypothetical protein
MMKLLHLSAYACNKCEGPVVAGSFGTRESGITRESSLTPIGAVCLVCGDKQAELNNTDLVRHFAPTEWVLLRLMSREGFA